MRKPDQELGHATFKSYMTGFFLAGVLSLVAYFLVEKQLFIGKTLILTVSGLGLLQAWVVLLFFINMHKEPKPRWNSMIFLFMVMVTVMLVLGSLWIMYHLNYNLMPKH